MDWLLTVAQFVVNEVLSVPAFLIGIITAVGLAALRRPGRWWAAPSRPPWGSS